VVISSPVDDPLGRLHTIVIDDRRMVLWNSVSPKRGTSRLSIAIGSALRVAGIYKSLRVCLEKKKMRLTDRDVVVCHLLWRIWAMVGEYLVSEILAG
jgi:hypothetical protein